MMFLIILFLMTICVVPFMIEEPSEPVVYFTEPGAAPPLAAAPEDPVLIFPEPVVDTGPPMVVHVLQHGESLNDVAQRYGVTINDLVAVNPGLAEQNIVPGAEINIRPQEVVVIVETGSQPLFPTPAPLQGDRLYTVVTGDTLSGIAARYNLTTQAILARNPQITDPDALSPGQVIVIPAAAVLPITGGEAPQPQPQPPEQTIAVYLVQRGDTLARIARRFDLSLETLLASNPQIENPSRIYPGQQIVIPQP